MTNEKHGAASSEAHKALDTIKQMKRSAMRRATPPRWFGVAIALLMGTLVTLAVADMRQLQVLVILGIGLVIVYQSQKSGVALKTLPIKLVVITLIRLLPMYYGTIVVGQLMTPVLGQTLAAIFGGGVFAIAVYLLSLIERRLHLSKSAAGKS